MCPAARRRTTVSTMAESVDRSGWCVVSCTIDDVPASRRKQIYTVRGQSGQYTMLREPMGKELRIRTKFDYYDERFRADHSGNVDGGSVSCGVIWFRLIGRLEFNSYMLCSKESSTAVV